MELSDGYMFGIVFFVALVTLCLIIAVGAWRDGERWGAVCGIAGAALSAVIWFGVNSPAFDMQYHAYRNISGTVTEIERDNDVRMFELKGDPRDLSCMESWCTKVEVGDVITLNCIRTDSVPGANTWECEFVKLKENDRVLSADQTGNPVGSLWHPSNSDWVL